MASYQPYSPGRITAKNVYPPAQDVMYPSVNSTTTFETKVDDDPRRISRTPSPTPSEAKEMKSGAIDWKAMANWRFWIRREWLWYYVAIVIIVTLTGLITIYHKQIVHWLTPVATFLRDQLKFGWLVPIGVLFVISFPPLFGHEIVAILCGLVWGLWIGFAIVAAGTFLGEVGNFYAFKYCCRARGEKLEKSKISYACLARVVRDGGFKIALIARLSAIPGHFTTAVFSTCGMGIFVFSLAAILSMPKQFITVYLGVILEQSATGEKDTKSRIISDVVLGITILITIAAMWYILRQMDKVKPSVIYDRRKARQGKLARAGGYAPPYSGGPAGSSTEVFNPNHSDSDIPLTQSGHQQWDKNGKAVGYVPGPSFIFTPKPRLQDAPSFPLRQPKDVEEGVTRPFVAHGREDSTDPVEWDVTANRPLVMRTTSPPNMRQPPPGLPVTSYEQKPNPKRASQVPLNNPYSPSHQQSMFVSQQTPTQAAFPPASRGWQQEDTAYHPPASVPHAVEAPRSPFLDPVPPHASHARYESDSSDGHAYGGYGHTIEPTDATFRTAFTSSPGHDSDDDLRSHSNTYQTHNAPNLR